MMFRVCSLTEPGLLGKCTGCPPLFWKTCTLLRTRPCLLRQAPAMLSRHAPKECWEQLPRRQEPCEAHRGSGTGPCLKIHSQRFATVLLRWCSRNGTAAAVHLQLCRTEHPGDWVCSERMGIRTSHVFGRFLFFWVRIFIAFRDCLDFMTALCRI